MTSSRAEVVRLCISIMRKEKTETETETQIGIGLEKWGNCGHLRKLGSVELWSKVESAFRDRYQSVLNISEVISTPKLD